MHVHVRGAALHLGRDVEVRRARQVGVDAALHAHLGRARRPGLLRPLPDLVQGQRVGVRVGAALRERAEPAAGVADVGEVDVPGDDERDVVAVDLAAQAVGERRQGVQVVAVRAQQRDRLVVGEGGGVALGLAQGGRDLTGTGDGGRLGDDDPALHLIPVTVDLGEVVAAVGGAADRVDRHVQVGAARGLAPAAVRLLPGAALRERGLVREAGGRVGEGGDVRGDARVEPRLADVGRVDGEPLPQREARGGGDRGELVDLRPGALGVDVVRGQR